MNATATKLYKDGSGNLVEVLGALSDPVEFTRQGGGFVQRMSKRAFERTFTATEAPGFALAKVSGDWMADSEWVDAYITPMRWNGWAMPYFAFDAAMKLLPGMGGRLAYDAARDAFVLTDPDMDGPEAYEADFIEVNGESIKVYPIGAGSWCWYQEEA